MTIDLDRWHEFPVDQKAAVVAGLWGGISVIAALTPNVLSINMIRPYYIDPVEWVVLDILGLVLFVTLTTVAVGSFTQIQRAYEDQEYPFTEMTVFVMSLLTSVLFLLNYLFASFSSFTAVSMGTLLAYVAAPISLIQIAKVLYESDLPQDPFKFGMKLVIVIPLSAFVSILVSETLMQALLSLMDCGAFSRDSMCAGVFTAGDLIFWLLLIGLVAVGIVGTQLTDAIERSKQVLNSL